MAKFCTNCGMSLSDTANFCNGCGTKQDDAPPVQQQPIQQPQPALLVQQQLEQHQQTQQAQPIIQPQLQHQQQSAMPEQQQPLSQQSQQPLIQQQQYEPYTPPAVKTKKKRRIPLVVKIIGIVVILIAAGITAVVVSLNGAGKKDYYKLGNDQIPSVKLALAEERKLTGTSSSSALGGVSTKVITYQVSGSEQNADMVNYLTYLRDKDGFLLLTGYDFNGPKGTCVVGRNSVDAGYEIQLQIEYDRSGYTISLLKQKGEITANTPESSSNNNAAAQQNGINNNAATQENNSDNNAATQENNSDNNAATQESSRTPAETVLLYADLCNACDYNGLQDVLCVYLDNLDSEEYTFISIEITVQNPDAQMEPFEIEHYKKEIDDLLDTAIVCSEVIYVFKDRETKEDWEFVMYLDYYLISTKTHTDWMIITWADQAGAINTSQPINSGNNSQTTNPSSDTGNLTKEIFEYLNDDTYHMKMNIIAFGEENVVEIFVSNEMTATVVSFDGMDMRMVVKDGKSYTVADEEKTVYVTDADTDGDTEFLGDTDDMTYLGEGSGDFRGKTYKYDEYRDADGDLVFYYVDGGALKGIRTVVGGEETDIEIITLDKIIPESVFDIPSNYEVMKY